MLLSTPLPDYTSDARTIFTNNGNQLQTVHTWVLALGPASGKAKIELDHPQSGITGSVEVQNGHAAFMSWNAIDQNGFLRLTPSTDGGAAYHLDTEL